MLSIILIFLHLSEHCACNSNGPSNSQLLLLYQEHYMLKVSKAGPCYRTKSFSNIKFIMRYKKRSLIPPC